jgi:hypothetical protein
VHWRWPTKSKGFDIRQQILLPFYFTKNSKPQGIWRNFIYLVEYSLYGIERVITEADDSIIKKRMDEIKQGRL